MTGNYDLSNIVLTSEIFSNHPERWCIRDNKGNYWNGELFVSTKKDSQIYDKKSASDSAIHEVLIKLFSGKKTSLRRFVLPIGVNFYGSKRVPEEDVKQYLQDAMKMHIDADNYGYGIHGNLILPRVIWSAFKESK